MDLQTLLAGLTPVGIAACIGLLWKMGNRLTRIETKVGINGSDGIAGEIKGIRGRVHDHGEKIQTLFGKHELLTQRVDRLDPEGA